jgi:holo-[acyl-carrier protein] synthase
MTGPTLTDWRPMASAPRDGRRILVTVRETEQGPAEVDIVKWAATARGGEAGWLATDSDPEARVVYAEGELAAWMPLPDVSPKRTALRSAFQPYAGGEMDGSAI